MAAHRPLSQDEVKTLQSNGCTATSWKSVEITDATNLDRIHRASFCGAVRIGALDGKSAAGLPAGILDATLEDVTVGDNARIANVNGILAAMEIGAGASVIGVGTCTTDAGATFANGVQVEAVNEGGGREVPLYDGLSSQTAWLLAMYLWRPKLVERLRAMVKEQVAKVTSDRGSIGEGATVEHVQELRNVRIGAHATVRGATRLNDVTILSEKAAPTFVGSNVILDHCIVAEGAKVDSGAVLDKCFVGQACKVGRTFSGENCLFFANSECFHSEAVACFGGPYTVTHHRSTLLIAGTFSFYNAGSATNQSNHMYKLGPVHQGLLERGSKTASGSYMLWPCVVGPFSVVMGKNMANFDLADFPFSYITVESDGTNLTPAMNLFTVGTTRDGAKWPKRDKRAASVRRDLIRFEVFSPFTVGRMLNGEKTLNDLAAKTDKSEKIVRHNGVVIKRLLLKFSARHYATAIDRYLLGEVLRHHDSGQLAVDSSAKASREWIDVSGLLVNKERFSEILARVESGAVKSFDELQTNLQEALEAYEKDAWAWVSTVFAERHGKKPADLDKDAIEALRAQFKKLDDGFTKKILADAEKEFDETAQIGFGVDGDAAARTADFEAVRGTVDENGFIQDLRKQIAGK